MKIFGLLLASIGFLPNAQANSLDPLLCPVTCNGSKSTQPFDFYGKAKSFGDPNNSGKPLGNTIQIPATEDNNSSDPTNPSESVPTSDFFNQMNGFEQWSAGQCGTSLNSPGDVQVAALCPTTNAHYNRWKLNVVNKHKSSSPYHAPATKKQMDDFFKAADSAKEKINSNKSLWYRDDGRATNFNNCKSEGIDPTNKDLFAVEIKGSICSALVTPKLPNSYYLGVPPGSYTKADVGGKASVYVFGKEFTILGGLISSTSPSKGNVYRSTQLTYMGDTKVNETNVQAPAIQYNNPIVLEHIHEGTSATFTIGPVPVTVEGGVDGKAQIDMVARQTNMWANARIIPGVYVDGYARAYVNFYIVKAGVDATIVLLHDTLDVYAFSGVAAFPVQKDGQTIDMFFHSQQIALLNSVEALSGKVDAFVKVAVPKFIGWRWKKYSTTIFNWSGLKASGYLYNNAYDMVPVNDVP